MAWPVFVLSLRLLFRRSGILLVANVLWLLLSLPIVTLPAATGALFYVAYRVVQEERALDPDYARISDFWVGFRRYAWQSTAVVLLNCAVFLLLGVALRFYWLSDVEPLRWLVGPLALIALLWLGTQIYLFPLLIVTPDQPPLHTVRQAILTALGHPLDTVLLLIWLLLIAIVCTVLTGPVFLILFALLAVTQTVALRFIRIRRGEIEPLMIRPDS